MNGWMDRRMKVWMDEWLDVWIAGWNKLIEVWMDICMD